MAAKATAASVARDLATKHADLAVRIEDAITAPVYGALVAAGIPKEWAATWAGIASQVASEAAAERVGDLALANMDMEAAA